jgi:hypothetical protein
MLASFWRDYDRLSPEQRAAFRRAVIQLVADLKAGQVREGFRIKRVRRRPGVWEMTWGPDGRAPFEYGEPVRPGEIHIVWRRIGSHAIFQDP